MRLEYAWAGTIRQLTTFLNWVGAAKNDDKPMLFGDVGPYPGSTDHDGLIVVSPNTKYIRDDGVHNLVDDLLDFKIGQAVLFFNMPYLENQNETIIII